MQSLYSTDIDTESLCAQAAYVSQYEDKSTEGGSESMGRINAAATVGHFL